MVSTGGGAFLLEDITLCGGGVHFDLEEGSSSSGVGGHTSLGEGCILIARRGSYFSWMKDAF